MRRIAILLLSILLLVGSCSKETLIAPINKIPSYYLLYTEAYVVNQSGSSTNTLWVNGIVQTNPVNQQGVGSDTVHIGDSIVFQSVVNYNPNAGYCTPCVGYTTEMIITNPITGHDTMISTESGNTHTVVSTISCKLKQL